MHFSLENENHDGSHYDEVYVHTPGKINRNINEEIQFQNMQNHYYGEEFDGGPTQIKTMENPYYDGGT